MTRAERIIQLAQAFGADVKDLRTKQGDLSALSTTAKGSLVAALNEVFSLLGSGTEINDTAGNGVTTATWSADKIFDSIEQAKLDVRNSLLGGASAAFDTFLELQNALQNNPNLASDLATQIGNRVRFDAAQTLTVAQKLQACENIGLGNPDYDFVVDYNLAKA